jgi:hypothetical protein
MGVGIEGYFRKESASLRSWHLNRVLSDMKEDPVRAGRK